ncbi:MAG: endonuclease [Flavobacteriales bacterium]|nr:MAG: endonuclease [Flavobacteriales bacterium]
MALKKLSFLNRILFLINSLLAFALIFALFLPRLAPEDFGEITVLSLLTPILILLNIIFLIYWILAGFKKQLLQPFLVLVLTYFLLPYFYIFDQNDAVTLSKNNLSVLTYNVRKFNQYKWLATENVPEKIKKLITVEAPDVVLLQEYTKTEQFRLNYPYSYNHYNKIGKNKVQTGLAIFSKYPIANKASLKVVKYNSSIIYADIVKSNDTIRVYNFHLESLGIDPKKNYYGYTKSKNIIKRLGNSFKTQQKEVISLKESIKNCPYKIVLGGDMNNNAFSWTYKNLQTDFTDSFSVMGNGFGTTYSFNGFPLRIDYIFADKSMKVVSHKNYDLGLSDHNPIMATMNL